MLPPPVHPFLRPLPLGPSGGGLPDRLPPGPMEGLTEGAFVRVMGDLGLVNSWITPFLRLSTAVPRPTRLRQQFAEFLQPPAGAARPLPLVVQLMGIDIPLLAAAAHAVCQLDGVGGVDLNCACPSPTVLRNGGGGARLADPRWIRDALLALRRACPRHGVSVKLRTGVRTPQELPAILDQVAEAQPDAVLLHWRTAAELYQPVPDGWRRLALARARLPTTIPILASGDLFSAAEALRLHRETGVDGLTPARGLLRNPWLIQEIRAACLGHPPAPRHEADRCAFLRQLAATAHAHGRWRRGFLLELARHLFGADSPRFHALIATNHPTTFQAALHHDHA